MIWVEILRLPLCAYNDSYFKKVATIFGDVHFLDDDEDEPTSVGRVCIKMKDMFKIDGMV